MKVVYLGSGDIGVPSLRWLIAAPQVELVMVVTQPDRAAGRGLSTKISETKRLALEGGIPLLQPPKLKEEVSALTALHPDLLVVMAYGQILPQVLLDVPRLGALNLHASLLPRHRGAAPIHAAVLAGDKSSGVTAMWMDAGLDTGDILLLRECLLSDEETAGTLHDRLAALAPEALAEALVLLAAGQAPRVPQDDEAATYAPKLDRAAGRIDWQQSAADIARQVRALHPWPGCTATFALENGKKVEVKLHAAVSLDGSAPAGQVGEALSVGCGGGGLLGVLELQPAGGRRMKAEQFLRGHQISGAIVRQKV